MKYFFLFLSLSLSVFSQPTFTFRDMPVMAPRGATTLMTGIAAAWSFDEQITSGTRVDSVASLPLYDWKGNIKAIRGQMSGALAIANGVNALTNVDSSTVGMGVGVKFTIAAWVTGNDGNNAFIGNTDESELTPNYDFDSGGTFQIYDNGGNLHQIITGVAAANGAWTFYVMGCDGVNMFASANGAAPTTTTCTEARRTGVPFYVQWRNGGVDEVYIWKRALSASEITQLYNSGYGLKYPFTNSISSQMASNYLWAVVNNGGTPPSQAKLNAVDTFVAGAISDGFFANLQILYGFPAVADLGALKTPIFTTTFYDAVAQIPVSYGDPAVNHSLVIGDVSANGVTGNASTKYLDTVVTLDKVMTTPQSTTTFIYDYNANASGVAAGGNSSATGIPEVQLNCKFTDNNNYNILGLDANKITVTPSPGNGFYLQTRTSSTVHIVYFASSVSPWAQIGTTDTTSFTGTMPAVSAFILGLNGSGSLAVPCSDTISAFGIVNTGVSSSTGQKVYNRIQTLLTSWGGGFR